MNKYYLDIVENWIFVAKVVPTGKKGPNQIPEYRILSSTEVGELAPDLPDERRSVGDTVNLVDYDLYTEYELIKYLFEELLDILEMD